MTTLSVPDWASMISASMAAVAALLSAVAIYANQKAAREQRAADSLKRYLELSIAYPKLSTEGGLGQTQQQYEWFVSFILIMTQEVLRAYPHDRRWKQLMCDQLKYNADELREWKKADANYFAAFGSDVQRLVNSALGEEKTQ